MIAQKNMKLDKQKDQYLETLGVMMEGMTLEIRMLYMLYHIPYTCLNIGNEDELTQTLEDSVKQLLLHIEKLETSTCDLKFNMILSIIISYYKCDPIKTGKYIESPEWIKLKKTCIKI